jgi:hypothetical protein
MGNSLLVVEAEREWYRRARFGHFPRRQPSNAIADVAFGNGLKIVEVRRESFWQPVGFGQNDPRGYTADRRMDGRNGDLLQYGDGGIARQDQHGPAWSFARRSRALPGNTLPGELGIDGQA